MTAARQSLITAGKIASRLFVYVTPAIAYPRDASKAAAHAKRAKRAAAAVNDAGKELGFVPTGDAVALPALAAP